MIPVIISPLIFHAGYVPGTFKAKIFKSSIENNAFSLHTPELKSPSKGFINE